MRKGAFCKRRLCSYHLQLVLFLHMVSARTVNCKVVCKEMNLPNANVLYRTSGSALIDDAMLAFKKTPTGF